MNDAPHTYRNLLNPELTTLLFVDCLAAAPKGVPHDQWGSVEKKLAALAKAAKSLQVPTIATALSADRASNVAKEFADKDIFVRSKLNPWEEENLRKSILSQGQRRLLVAGLWMESTITFAVLCALEEGLDVYLIEDAALPLDGRDKEPAFARMTTAGMVPVSSRQVLIEWRRHLAPSLSADDLDAMGLSGDGDLEG